MSKNREAVTCNGRPAFYASMYEDIRKCAMDSGWAVALHGSLSSDMDIMAMPWAKEAIKFEELVNKISRLFDENSLSENYTIKYDEKSHNRIVATIPIWADFYLDISTIEAVPVVHGEWIYENYTWHCGVCGFHPFKGYIPKEPGFNFCPNCRAKMDGGSD